MIQFFHIPKTGTSINWFLHDYFNCLERNATQPCMKWLETVRETLFILSLRFLSTFNPSSSHCDCDGDYKIKERGTIRRTM